MGDIAMLELVARFVGLPWDRWVADGNDDWNPLTNDDDAFRLQVKLKIVPQHAKRYVVAIFLTDTTDITMHEDYGSDPCAATRRAITCCAAAIAQQRGSGEWKDT